MQMLIPVDRAKATLALVASVISKLHQRGLINDQDVRDIYQKAFEAAGAKENGMIAAAILEVMPKV